MNYLAHIALAGGDAQHQVGGLLGDFIRGPADKVAQQTTDLMLCIAASKSNMSKVVHMLKPLVVG